MRELKLGDGVLSVRATPLALLFYRQEFGRDMVADFISAAAVVLDVAPSLLDETVGSDPIDEPGVERLEDSADAAMRITWAMAKAADYTAWPSYTRWLEGLDGSSINISFLTSALTIAADGLLVSDEHKSSGDSSDGISVRPDIEWLALAARCGLSFDQVNLLRVDDLAAYIDAYLPDGDRVRQATQDDINRLLT